MEQKCELAERELTEMKDEIQRMKEDSEQTLQNLEVWLSRTSTITRVSNSLVTFHTSLNMPSGSETDLLGVGCS